jgi:hypothetical protein
MPSTNPKRTASVIAPWCLVAILGCGQDPHPAATSAGQWTVKGPICGYELEYSYRPADTSTLKDFALVHDGARFHLFAMRAQAGWLRGGARDFAHASSTDLVTWEDHAILDLRRPVVAEDHVWAPHVIRHEGRWLMFYTGVSYEESTPEHNVQRIVSAVSEDLVHWTPTTTVIEGDPSFMQWGNGSAWSNDLRDGMLWRDGERWVLFATVRLHDGRQCIAIAQSTDLHEWQWIVPLEFTAGMVSESPTMVRYRGRLWLFWTAAARVHVASATRVEGPYTLEDFELIGYANETLALRDGSVLLPRVRAHAIAFVRMLPDAVVPPVLSPVVSPLCFDGQILQPDPTVLAPR